MEAVAPLEIRSPAEAAMSALQAVRRMVGYDGAALMVLDPVTHLPSTGAVDALPEECCEPFFAFELSDDPRTFRRLAVGRSGAVGTSVDDGAHDRLATAILAPYGFGSELRTVCRDAQAVWGGITLIRAMGSPPFGASDRARLEDAAEGIGEVLRAAVVASLDRRDGEPEVTAGAGVVGVLIVEDGRVAEASPEVAAMLRELEYPAPDEYRHVDHLRALAGGQLPFTTVLRTPRGWLTAHGTALSDRRVAIAVSAAGPERLLGARVVAAGLSPREVEVTRLLCQGLSDREIARELGVSDHTAHDHVRSVRQKLGVRSRSEVSATIFADRYFEAFLQSAAIRHS